ncbi:unnamed protein product [Adineta ricciae]|uniref:CipC-like antibiotic response protein n=1 Tax=Adineta ricciae TaxID=249248 RepID=A0A815V5C6_ADIRI|nr:unnamed protein product [Adineta ricciae]CAF1531487.1 unnamed protein product [Adineta ricciae]
MSFFENLFGHHEAQNAHRQMYEDYSNDYDQREHKGSFTHEMIAAAAGFEALKAYEDRCRRSGEQISHPMMKEILAGFAAAEVDKLFETKGIDYLDRERAKRMATEQAYKLANDKYGSGQVYQGDDFNNYQQQNYNQGGWQNDGQGQGRWQNDFNQDYGGSNSDYQDNGRNNYGNQGQQQWGREDDEPRPEHHHHHHHRREEYD